MPHHDLHEFPYFLAHVRIAHAAIRIHRPHHPSIIKKAPSRLIRRGFSGSAPHLIFQGISTLLELAPASRMRGTGCCGFFGPVPPPLWISRSYYLTDPYLFFCASVFSSFLTALEPSFPPPIFRIHVLSKDFTASTHFHLLGPTSLGLSTAEGSIDKPAEVAQVEFPRRARIAIFRRTASNIPAGAGFPGVPPPIGYQEERLAFNVPRNLAPSLFEALDGLEGSS
jgi:hypothetical protein